jgi:hypothetical protein
VTIKDFWYEGRQDPRTKVSVECLMGTALDLRILACTLIGKIFFEGKLTPDEKLEYSKLKNLYLKQLKEVADLYQTLGLEMPKVTVSRLCNVWP